MKDAGARYHMQKLKSDDGLKNKIKRVTSGTILNKEKNEKEGENRMKKGRVYI